MHYLKLRLSKAAVTKNCFSKGSKEAYDVFMVDIFRANINTYSAWDAVKLKFDFNASPQTLSLEAASGKAFKLPILVEKQRRVQSRLEGRAIKLSLLPEELEGLRALPQAQSGCLEFTIKQLKKSKACSAIAKVIGNQRDNEIYAYLAEIFMSQLATKTDRENLVNYASQGGLYSYLGFFTLSAKPYISHCEGMHIIEVPYACGAEYLLTSSVHVFDYDESSQSKLVVGRISLAARYSTQTGYLLEDPHIMINFSRALNEADIKRHVHRFMQNYAANRSLTHKARACDVGPIKTEYDNVLRICFTAANFLLIAGLIPALLMGLNVLPPLAFLSTSFFSAALSSALLLGSVVVVATIFLNLGFSALSKLSQRPSAIKLGSTARGCFHTTFLPARNSRKASDFNRAGKAQKAFSLRAGG